MLIINKDMNIKQRIQQMDDSKREKLGEVVRFGIVGVAATILQYVIYLVMIPSLAWGLPPVRRQRPCTGHHSQHHCLYRQFRVQLHCQHTLHLPCQGQCQARSRLYVLSHHQLHPADGLSESLRGHGTDQADSHVAHTLCLHSRQLPLSKILPEEVKNEDLSSPNKQENQKQTS